MNKQSNDRMFAFKKTFSILLILDIIGAILADIALLPTFMHRAEFGQPMMSIMSATFAALIVIQLFEILTKVFLIKSTSPTFSWASGRKGYIAAARLLLLVNSGAVTINLLSSGGEGETIISQGNLYLRVLAAVAEIITVFCYLRKVKKR